ncbi:hypothetical protein ACX05_00765 [Vibrio parahaemolyticus]|uniref:Uncharacterized protein n=1 Tax=Vibrio parahaemolyticus TaxID=670 RepID=A0AAW3J2Z2_VIBPH|nr:hypothetical protein ACX09_18710 [Vibrio alginolyticus]KOY42502.1 hypothetical protein ACX05_00765 [Vibrio parahaemolyticus]
MIHWFTTVFSQPAQKAQLFSIVLSAFVAFSVLLLNQWFTSRRARKDHMINKIEEFYEAIGEYESVLSSYSILCLLKAKIVVSFKRS